MLNLLKLSRRVISRALVVLLSSLAITVTPVVFAQEVDEVTFQLPSSNESSTVQVLVEFFGEPASRTYGRTYDRDRAQGRGAATASAVSASRSQISANKSEQSRVLAAIATSGVQTSELYRATRAVNGIAYTVARTDIDKLRAVQGVKAVHIIEQEYLTMSTTIPFLGVPAVWSGSFPLGLTGQGVKIGIIDTGVDYQHATFGGTGALADYQANNRTAAPDAFYPNARVVGGFDFAGDAYTGTNAPAPDADPMDCNGHGTHVASTAAGGGVTAAGAAYTGPYDTTTDFSAANLRIGPGVAPRASIYGLRVFGCTGSTGLTIAAIEWSLDPNGDSDMSDHLDVINMSLGSNFGSLANTSSIAADNAARMGVHVVASAGNAGDTYTISGSPGAGQRVIATAATGDNGLPGASMTVNAPASIAGSYAASAAPAALTTVAPNGQSGNVVLVNDGSTLLTGGTINDGCQTPFTNAADVAGNIALIDRGACGFADKLANAKLNGAIGVIIVNNVAGLTPPGLGGSLATPSDIPMISITRDAGIAIKARLTAAETVNVTFVAANLGDALASFSSRGPRGGLTGVKPDLAAPGLAITAAQTGVTCTAGACQTPNASGYVAGSLSLVLQGTSMAAPHAAGMMALLTERYPDRSAEEMKAIAMNTSLHDVYQFAGNVNRIGVDRAGAGRIDTQKAVEATVAAFNADEAGAVSLSFVGEVVGTQTQTKRLRVVNYSSTAQTFSLAIDTAVEAPGMSFSLPGGSSVTVPANGSLFVDVRVSAVAAQMKHTRDVSADPTQSVAAPAALAGLGALPRHYITNESGFVNFSQGANKVLRVPIYAALRPASNMSAPDTLTTGGAPTGSSSLPLSGTGVCTGTESAASCAGTFPVDDVSLVSAFELHAIGPKKTNIPGYANIRHVGVSFDAATGLYLFAVSTWGNWGSPTDVAFNISVDNNEDGTFDRVIFNTNAGTLATLFGSNTPAQDAFLNAVFTPPGNVSFGGAATFVNRLSAAVANSALFGSDVMFLAATPAQLGLVAGDTTFRYKVETCFGFNPLCATKVDSLPGPFYWNSAAQGLNFGGTHGLFDLNGATVPVTWNTANMTTNGSIGGLLLHHHNESGKRAEVFAVEGTGTADLSVTQSITGLLSQGDNVTISVTAVNVTGVNATGVTVNNVLPPGLAYVSDTSGGSYNSATGAWAVGNLASGATATFNIVANVTGLGSITVESQISGAQLDTVPANDFARNTFNVAAQSVLGATVTPTATPATAGSSATFDIDVTNSGTDTLFNVVVTASPPAPAAAAAAPITTNIASIAGGARVSVPVTVTIPNMAGLFQLPVTISAENAPPIDRLGALAVISPAAVGITKTVSSGPYAVGLPVVYTITLTNSSATSQQDNPGDELVDVLPASLMLVSASAGSGTTAADTATNTVRWNGMIPSNSSVVVTINARVKEGSEGSTINNQATANSDADGNGANEVVTLSDDPSIAGAANPTAFAVAEKIIPTLGALWMIVLAGLLAGIAGLRARRRSI